MRKLIAIVIMIFVTFNFYTAVKKKQPASKNEKELAHMLEDIQQSIDKAYPDDPLEIIDIHNKLMDILYNRELVKEQVELVINLQRKLYSEELLELNPLPDQLEDISNELLNNKEKDIKIISSKIVNSYYSQPEVLVIKVTHYTNQQDVLREYVMIKEDSNNEKQWKIYGWENIVSSITQEE